MGRSAADSTGSASLPDVSNLDAVMLLDARIAHARARRAAAERFSEAYWEADDHLAWLRMVREEAGRTGHVPGQLVTLLASTPVAVEIDRWDGVLGFETAPVDGPRHSAVGADEVDDALVATRVA